MVLRKDFGRDLEMWLRNVRLNSARLTVEQKSPSHVIDDIYDLEIKKRYKNMEERLINRIGLWIDFNRVLTKDRGAIQVNVGKFHTAKRFRKVATSSQKFMKFRSISAGQFPSRSVDNLNKDAQNNEVNHPQVDRNRLSPSYSTNDLLSPSNTEAEANTESLKTLKRRFRFIFFRKSKNYSLNDGGESTKNLRRESNRANKRRSRLDSENSDDSKQTSEASDTPTAPHSNSYYIRPSLFAMKSFNAKMPQIETLSVTTNSKTQNLQKSPVDRQRSNSLKFNTNVAVVEKTEPLLASQLHRDLLRSSNQDAKHGNNNGQLKPKRHQDIFYTPHARRADMGNI